MWVDGLSKYKSPQISFLREFVALKNYLLSPKVSTELKEERLPQLMVALTEESLNQLKTLALAVVPGPSLNATLQNLYCLLILALTDIVSLLSELNLETPSVIFETIHSICLERSTLIY